MESENPNEDRPSIPEGDFSDLPSPKADDTRPEKDWSKSFDKATSKLAKREAKADIYENADGTKTAVLATDDINWKDVDGKWHRIDPTLVDDGKGGWRNRSGPVGITVPGTTGDGPLARLEGDGWSVGYRLEGAKHGVKAKTKDAKAVYDDLLPGVDVEEQALPKGVKDLLVLEAAPADGADAVFRFPLQAEGLTPGPGEDGSVVFRDAAGTVVVEAPATVSWGAGDAPGEGEDLITPLTLVQDGDTHLIEVRVPGPWLATATFPVTIDPSLDAGRNTAQYDAFASSVDPNGNYNGARQYVDGHYMDFVGFDNWSPSSQQYTYQYFDLGPVMGKLVYYGEWRDWTYLTKGYAHDPGWEGYYRLWPVAGDWDQSTIRWNNLPNHRAEYAEGFADAGSLATQDVTDWVDAWASGEWASRGIAIDTAGLPSGVRFAASEDGDPTRPYLYVTYNERPTVSQPYDPFDGATVIQDQPTFSSTMASDDDSLRYLFRISTQSDGTGTLVESGWLTFPAGTNPTWAPPKGALVNGTTYYWSVAVDDGVYGPQWSDPDTFKFDLRLGEQPAMPTDGFSGVTVNLATGNAHVRLASPSFDTVGGAMAIDYSYNSRVPQRYAATPQHVGLMGTYTDDTDGTRRMVRRDRQLDFNWSSGSPGGRIGSDQFRVTWTGYVTVPASGAWTFGAAHDDQVTLVVNGATVLDTGCCSGGPRWGSSVNLTAGQTVPITVSMAEGTGAAYLQLWTKGPGTSPDGFVVPSDWLSIATPTLPAGWSMSADGLDGLAYTSLEIGDTTATLYGADGTAYPYVRQADLSWKPTGIADDVLTVVVEDGKTTWIVHGDDGVDYTFDDAGRLVRAVTTADDNRKPAAVSYDYDAATGRLKGLVDPLTSRRIDLVYFDTGVTCPKNSTAGLTEDPPVGMLCQVKYWPGTDPAAGDTRAKTSLYYKLGYLARVEDPGGEVTDLVYDGDLRLAKVRDPLAADVVAAGLRADTDDTWTAIAYDGQTGHATGVTAPAPLAGAARPGHSYEYDTPNRFAKVHVAGLTEPNGYARRVKWDFNGHVEEDYDTAGLVVLSYKDGRGIPVLEHERKAPNTDGPAHSTVFDHAGRPVEQYGPALASCYSIQGPDWPGWNRPPGYTGVRPGAQCTVPVTTTAYDESAPGVPIKGLAASYWDTANVSGSAVSHATGVGHNDGSLSKDWGTTGMPDGIASTDNWSARFTGEIRFPTARTYTLRLCADDGVRLFVDDAKLIDDWRDTGYVCREANTVADRDNTRKRIRVDYYERTGDARLDLYWRWSGVGDQLVPGANLAPRYGLATTTTDPDGRKTFTEFARPEYAQASATRVDPAGLNLLSTTEHEAPGEGHLRRKWRTMPKGPGGSADPTRTIYSYYITDEVAPTNECGGAASNGMLKRTTGADPTGSQGPVVREVVYDAWNRVKGGRVVGDARWACTTYDLRGRITSSTDSSNKTTTVTYSTPGEVTTTYVDSSGTSRTTVEKFDLLGRSWSYTDEHGTTTRRTFDQAGRAKEVFRKFTGETEVKVQEFAYTNENRVASTTEHVSGGPRTTTYAYDAATGKPTATTRPNGVVTTTAYNADTGRLSSMNHTKGATRLSNWSYDRTPSGDVSSDTLASDVTAGRTRVYGYDGAGRLTTVTEGATTRRYAYDANGNRCARAVNCNGPEYIYDDADRIQSSPDWASYTYDSHGNMTSATARTQPPGGSLNQTFSVDPANPSSYEIVAGQAGNLSAGLDWNAGSPYATQTPTGSIPASGTSTTTVPVDGMSYVRGALSWTQGTRTRTDSLSGSAPASGTTRTLAVTAPGVISVSTDWAASQPGENWSGTVAALGQSDRTLTASANGTLQGIVLWTAPAFPNPNPDLTVEILDPSGTVVATGTPAGPNEEWAQYNVTGIVYPATRNYTVRVRSLTVGSDFTLQTLRPTFSDLDLELYNPSGTKVAQATGSTSKPESLSYTATSGNTGNYTLKVLTKGSSPASFTGSASYQELAHADLTLNLKNPAGTTVATDRWNGGVLLVNHRAASGGNYTLQIVNNSPDISVPSFSMPWSTTMQATDTWTDTNVPASATRTRTLAFDGPGYVTTDLTWTQGTRTRTDTVSGSVSAGSPSNTSLGVTAAGTVSATVDWGASTTSGSWNDSVGNVGQTDRTITVSANGTVSASVSWPAPAFPNPNPDLNLELLNASGTVVATGTATGANAESLSYGVTGIGAYPANRTYTLRVRAVALGSGFTLSSTWPVTADVDVELWKGGTRVAQATGSSAKPEILSHNVTSGNTGTYTLKVLSKDHSASLSGSSASYPELKYANVTLRLKNPSGTAMSWATSSGGSITLADINGTVGGDYTLEVVNNSSDLTVPSLTATTRVPRTHTAIVLQLKDAAGQVVAQDSSAARPKSIGTAVQPGRYTLVVSSTGTATATLTASYPGRPARQVVAYDANDHATSVDDGTTTIAEALSPSGRVIRRVVRDSATQQVLEDTIFGYADGSDAPAYSRPTGGSTVTTYLDGVIYTVTTAAWQLANNHGDIVGTTDAAGTFTAVPLADEFGVGEPPASRLGWLGNHERFNVGGSLRLVRMGVRLYDPNLGRFSSVDPVEGGTPNDYVYPIDPVNEFDLDGRAQNRNPCLSPSYRKKHAKGQCRGFAGRSNVNLTVGMCAFVCVEVGLQRGRLGAGAGVLGFATPSVNVGSNYPRSSTKVRGATSVTCGFEAGPAALAYSWQSKNGSAMKGSGQLTWGLQKGLAKGRSSFGARCGPQWSRGW